MHLSPWCKSNVLSLSVCEVIVILMSAMFTGLDTACFVFFLHSSECLSMCVPNSYSHFT